MRGRLVAVAVGVVTAAAANAPAGAGAAATVGDSATAPTDVCVNSAFVELQTTSPGGLFRAPSGGVLTSWSWHSGATPSTTVRLHVGRSVGGNNFLTVGRSELAVPVASTLNTYPTRIPVLAGDVIGAGFSGTIGQCVLPVSGYDYHLIIGDPMPGVTSAWTPAGFSFKYPVSAQLEPDADSDGFGDETQDLCPTDADTVKACRDKTAPETTLGKTPKKKEKKKPATFEFTASEAGATFRCSLSGAAFAPCTSPHAVTAKKGLNVFTVFAKDAVGNVDDSPATYSWTYKKKPKKK